ncbi:metallophosphoesterase [Guggenheimella bovis]
MRVFVISDLHLGFGTDKPMNIFGDHWLNHHKKVKTDWLQKVSQEDIVIVGGDISWAMRLEEALVDLEWIDALPGKKIFIKGNHDYWWQSLQKLETEYPNIHFMQNNAYIKDGLAITGTRGWILPGSEEFTIDDERIFEREKLRLERSLIIAHSNPEVEHIITALHYPPLLKGMESSDFTDILERYNVKDVTYGHLHGKENWHSGVRGKHHDINYYLTSADSTDFKLTEITR